MCNKYKIRFSKIFTYSNSSSWSFYCKLSVWFLCQYFHNVKAYSSSTYYHPSWIFYRPVHRTAYGNNNPRYGYDYHYQSPNAYVNNGHSYDDAQYITYYDYAENRHEDPVQDSRQQQDSQADAPLDRSYRDNDDVGGSSILNLATHARIWSNATCGTAGPERYCRLSEHVPHRIPEQIQCGMCDANSANPAERHPISNAIDGTPSWWQSPAITRGKQYIHVTITLDLKQPYQVAYVIVKAANSPRPGNWILEKSLDGENFEPWQYFAETPGDCYNVYGVRASEGAKPRSVSDSQVHCTSHFSQLDPLEHGEVLVSLINGRPSENNPSPQLQDWMKARYIRLRLQKIRTLLADLMTFVYGNEKDLDPSVTDRYFYSIKDISVGGQCICDGQAGACILDQNTGEYRCECPDDMCGEQCDQCCPLFNQHALHYDRVTGRPVCEECNCFGHALSCVYNHTVAAQRRSLNLYGEYSGGGVCVDCAHNTQGLNCEECIDGYFRPTGTDPYSPGACVPCDCHYIGSTGLCVKDDSRYEQGLFAGDCVCREGYCGPNCDQCERGYSGYPYCEPCGCQLAGTINHNPCFGMCWCKPYVCGARCDTCQPGYFDLQADRAEGCAQCFCFGLSDSCVSSSWRADTVTTLNDWRMTDFVGSGIMLPSFGEAGSLFMTSKQAQSHGLNRALYWVAPTDYVGNKILSYGGMLEYVFSYSADTRYDDEDPYLANHDVILEGSGLVLGHSGQYYAAGERQRVRVRLSEAGWRHLHGSTSPRDTLVPKEEFLAVLADISRLLVRASYHVEQVDSSLHSVSMQLASATGTGALMNSVEVCHCPPGYAGTSCEQCAAGYVRVGSLLLGGTCEPCDCAGHAGECDAVTGECLGCQHHTQGPHCDKCQDGYNMGTDGACHACACPLDMPTNSFADECVMTSSGHTCSCREGYTGIHCERCADGYFGDPMIPGDWCKPCDCHGNTAGNQCDPLTGRCSGCLGNTVGSYCDTCQEGYYGRANDGDCRPCGCNVYGSERVDACESRTGQCECRPLYMGRACAQCVSGYGNIGLGCLQCQCNREGSVSAQCDPETGQCACLPGVGGVDCGKCLPAHYDFGPAGCKACECDGPGSLGEECDDRSGQCGCQPGVQGRTCDRCMVNEWGVASGRGCEACRCDPVGSVSAQCNTQTGQCLCRPGVTGTRCDRCAPGYYRFSRRGCIECESCGNTAQVCDPQSGQCACPPYTTQPDCARCVRGAWGYDVITGCTPCDCHPQGSEMEQCDARTGQCLCKDLYNSQKCDSCIYGYYGFPNCRYCDCDIVGTRADQCDVRGVCQCDGASGACTCKEHVVGRTCARCAEDAFSLQPDNPRGCTRCYCSARSTQCAQAPHTWGKSKIADVEFAVELVAGRGEVEPNAQGVLPLSPGTSLVSSYHASRPLYWSVPDYLLGDMTLSYNGALKFNVDNHVSGTSPYSVPQQYPEVYLLGSHVIRLVYSPLVQNRNRRRLIKFHEDYWKDESGQPIDRRLLMVALTNVQSLLVKLADTSSTHNYRLYSLQVDKAVPARAGGTGLALGIEKCVCPLEYTGLSCQDPADGYYRVRPEPGIVDLTRIDALIGYAKPCICHGHAARCHKETGVCIKCLHHTSGKNCEVCETGYYGDAKRGSPNDCRECLCGGSSNACHASSTNPLGFVCDECAAGYGGDGCDECAPGYFGNPGLAEGCIECACNPYGSQSVSCHPITGKCSCFPGILGSKCDQCAPRFAVIGGRCESCLVGCTGLLFEEIDNIRAELASLNLTPDKLIPWQKLRRIEQKLDALENLDFVSTDQIPGIGALWDEIARLNSTANEVEPRAHIDASESLRVRTDAASLRDKASAIERDMMDIQDLMGMVNAIVNEILNRIESGHFELEGALRRAERALRAMRARDLGMDLVQGQRERRLAEAMLERALMFIMDHSLDTHTPMTSMTHLRDDLNDLLLRGTQTNNLTSQALVIHKDNRASIARIKETLKRVKESEQGVRDILRRAKENLSSAEQLNNETHVNLQETSDGVNQLAGDVATLDTDVARLTSAVSDLDDPVNRAVEHANALAALADSLSAQFEGAREGARDPVNAAKAFARMVEAVESAEEALRRAQEAVRNVTSQVGDGEDGSLRARARESLARSRGLERSAREQEGDISGLRLTLQQHARTCQSAQRAITEAKNKLDSLNTVLDNTDLDIREEVQDLRYNAMSTIAQTNKIKDKAQAVKDGTENDLKPKLEALRSFSIDGIDKTKQAVDQVQQKIQETKNRTDKLLDHADVISQKSRELQYNFDKLRDMIVQTREQANSIRVSLKHDDRCYRRYAVDPQHSTQNEIKLYFKLNGPLTSDMLLFLLSNSPTAQSDFLALEVYNGRVRFSWDAGAGSAYVEHDEPIRYEPDAEDEQRWYEVIARRIANMGTLSVKKQTSPLPAAVAEYAASSPYTTLDVLNSTEMFIGGVPDDYRLPGILQATEFSGCIGDVSFDGKPIGLYNFRDLMGSGCNGCDPVPARKRTQFDVFGFNGYGYATMPNLRRYNPSEFFIMLDFKTFWGDALLFFAHNEHNGDYISLELVNGRVVFKFSFGGESTAVLSTISQYNTNTWVSVTAKRLELTGSLEVDSETVPRVSAGDIGRLNLDLQDSVLNFGGVPLATRMFTQRYGLVDSSFYGCLRGITVTSRSPVSPELMTGLYSGVATGCPAKSAYIVGFNGDGGYVELKNWNIPKSTTIVLSFKTEEENGLLLLGSGETPNAFYSVSLLGGRVEVYMNGGSGLRSIRSKQRYNDGRLHTLVLIKANRLVEMYVDDVAEGTMRLASGDARIAVAEAGLYVGGVPSGGDVLGTAASLAPLHGCVFNLVIDQRLLAFDDPVAFYRADIGRCRDGGAGFSGAGGAGFSGAGGAGFSGAGGSIDIEKVTLRPNTTPAVPSFTVTVRRPDPPTAQPTPTSCAYVGGYQYIDESVAFGGIKHGHSRVNVRKRDMIQEFNVTLEFRTFYPRGLILYLANAQQTEYIAIEMERGKIIVSYRGKNLSKELGSEGTLNDGLWHFMRISKSESEIVVQVNGDAPVSEPVARSLEVDNTLLVGGLPESYPPRDGLVSESFKGCMRDFSLNGVPLDLRNSESVMGFTQCFQHVERGAYFDGFNWAVYEQNYKILLEFTIELDFKTGARDGVLVSISTNDFSGLTLEIADGQVQFTAVNAGGRFSARTQACEFCFCDDRWHHVKAELIKNIVVLQVDGDAQLIGSSPELIRFLNTDSSLYIGGFPVYEIPQVAATGSQRFRGCMRDLVLNGTQTSWHAMHSLFDVHVSACPVTLP